MSELFGVDIAGIILDTFDGQLDRVVLYKVSGEVDERGITNRTAVAYEGRGVRLKWRAETALARGFPVNTVKVLMLQDGLPEPANDDELEVSGSRYRVLACDADPVNATWVLAAVVTEAAAKDEGTAVPAGVGFEILPT